MGSGESNKVTYLRDVLGLDAAFDYHQGLVVQLREAAPRGESTSTSTTSEVPTSRRGPWTRCVPSGGVALWWSHLRYNGNPPGVGEPVPGHRQVPHDPRFSGRAFADRADEAREELLDSARVSQARAVHLRRTRRGASRDRRSAGRSHPRQVRRRGLSGRCLVIDATHECRYAELISVQREDRRADFQEPHGGGHRGVRGRCARSVRGRRREELRGRCSHRRLWNGVLAAADIERKRDALFQPEPDPPPRH